MNLQEARELLELLETTAPDVDIRMSIDKTELLSVLKVANFHAVFESNAWRVVEITIPIKNLERNHV